MPSEADPDASRRPVWISFADHFLDTETRHCLPLSALTATEAGLSPEEARDVWRLEVVPAVGANLRHVAGEWAGWDEAWLIERIRSCRHRGLRALVMRRVPDVNERAWSVIEECMRALRAVAPERRRALADDLHALARHYFDFCPTPLEPTRHRELRRLFDAVLAPILSRALVGESRREHEARVTAALGDCRGGDAPG